MAKSARASVTKRNNRNLRAKVFGPAHDARTERLSAKLQELAAKPRPTEDKMVDVDQSAEQGDLEQENNKGAEEMEVDARGTKANPIKPSAEKIRTKRRELKVSKRKSKHSIVFASELARKAKIASKSKTKR